MAKRPDGLLLPGALLLLAVLSLPLPPINHVKSFTEVEIEDNTKGCVAIRKAFEMSHAKGKKELSQQDAALLIQLSYRAHLGHRSQVLRCLRDLAVAKAKHKEIRSFFYNISYRRHIVHDSEEHQRKSLCCS